MDVLPSWRDGALKRAILNFVDSVTDPNSACYVEPDKRLATFDHDGTLFVEKPLNAQITFVKDRLFNDDPEPRPATGNFFERLQTNFANWFDDIESDFKNITELAFRNVTPEQFRQASNSWIQTAVHPKFNRPYIDLVYKPMRELLSFLHKSQFDIYIVTGSSTDFIRPWSEQAYVIDNHHILGSSLKTDLEEDENGRLELVLEPLPFYFANGENKVRSIERLIAEQPIFAFGNSRGDIEMLRWAGRAENSFCGLVHHTDDIREYQYSPDPAIYLGDCTLDQAEKYQWQVVDMKNDWLEVF